MNVTQKRFFSQRMPGEYLDYLEYVPPMEEKKVPLLLQIHGAGSRGNDVNILRDGAALGQLKKGRNIPACIVAPQCHNNTWFDVYPVLVEFTETMIKRDFIDQDRVYVMGTSLGAYTVWQLCMSHPDWFAAAVPICGGGMYWNAARLKDIPIWAFHGECDKTVLICESEHMVEAVNKHGGNAKLTRFPGVAHNAWDYTYPMDELWQWLFEQKRGGK